MKLCEHCRGAITPSPTAKQTHNDRLYCSAKCQRAAHRARLEGELDAKRPTRKTTMADIDAAYQRAIASQRSVS